MWNCISCELWTACQMQQRGLISKAVPIVRYDGRFIRNPLVITGRWLGDGAVVYGEMVSGEAKTRAASLLKQCTVDFGRLDAEVDKVVWTLTNLFPHCLMMSIDGIRAKKKFFWDQFKLPNRHWLAANMMSEAYPGFKAFNTKKLTGRDRIDFPA